MSDVKLNLREMHGEVHLLELLIIEPPLPASAVIRHFIHSDHVERVREWIEHVTSLEAEVARLRTERDEARAGCGALELVQKLQQERRRAKKLETDVDRLMTQLWKMTNLANEEGLKVHALETEVERLRGVLRCEKTGHLCGTDTVSFGDPPCCPTCTAWMETVRVREEEGEG
jgi:hypothetical protein